MVLESCIGICMSDVVYTFSGKDITMNMCIQIRAVVDILQKHLILKKNLLKLYKVCAR